jgi:hypothetical protein
MTCVDEKVLLGCKSVLLNYVTLSPNHGFQMKTNNLFQMKTDISFFILFIYSHVHTLFGSFLPPAPLPHPLRPPPSPSQF